MLKDLIDIRDALVNAAGLKVKNEFDRGYQQGIMCSLRKVQALVEKLMEGNDAVSTVRREESGTPQPKQSKGAGLP